MLQLRTSVDAVTAPQVPPPHDAADALDRQEAVAPSSDPALAALLAKLAHELRTPLAAITALSEVMKDERLGPIGNPRYRAYAADIHETARHALAVVAAMLEPASAVHGKLEFVYTEVDPAAVVASTVALLRPLADRAHVQLVGQCEPRPPRLVADERSLRQVLINLVTNALKATPSGGVVRIACVQVSGGQVVLAVEDNGAGIDAQTLARVRGTATLAVSQEGTRPQTGGHGLPLVHDLAAANGAIVDITSSPGQGTSVRLTFANERIIPV